MPEIRTSRSGIDYLLGILRDRPTVITRVSFWGIPRSSGCSDVALKLGRYNRIRTSTGLEFEKAESEQPRSELTLDTEEFLNLVNFLQENYAPFQKGIKQYVPIDGRFDEKDVAHLKAIFENPEQQELIDFIVSHEIIPQDLVLALENINRKNAVEEFEHMLDIDIVEHRWQKWFEQNDWVLGTEFVRILDERDIDIDNISDFLMQAYDGFLDIVEIKRPEGALKFWMDSQDHGNYIPSSDLVKAITQASRYIYEVEREANSIKFLERVGSVKTVKPRCILIFGRSFDWDEKKCEAYRILNSSYHNLTILTYDHVLDRAKRIVGIE
ncbi:MAG: DUF4263 domain-containing protein [Candidatus Aminicenantes bacterium]|nr:DUF4263 domain-containing protein [Candidatus Aminicenantes bacterium]